jgi:ribosomal protein S18 acetylase RimI-like enzyme
MDSAVVRDYDPRRDMLAVEWLERDVFGSSQQSETTPRALLRNAIGFVSAVTDDSVQGFVLCDHNEDEATVFVYSVAVAAAHRNHGIGSALMQRLIDAHGDRMHMELTVSKGSAHDRLVLFYSRFGFSVSSVSPDGDGLSAAVTVMARSRPN